MGVLLDALERLPATSSATSTCRRISAIGPTKRRLRATKTRCSTSWKNRGWRWSSTPASCTATTPTKKSSAISTPTAAVAQGQGARHRDRDRLRRHSPRDQAGAFETVLGVLDELEINEIVFPIGGRLARVALRYVKPPEPEPAPPPPEPPPAPAPHTSRSKPPRRPRSPSAKPAGCVVGPSQGERARTRRRRDALRTTGRARRARRARAAKAAQSPPRPRLLQRRSPSRSEGGACQGRLPRSEAAENDR